MDDNYPNYPSPGIPNPLTYPGYISAPAKKKVYIAGPMRGRELFNFPAFDDARDALALRGYQVISPADMDRAIGFHPEHDTLENFDLMDAIDRDVEAIKQVDFVVVLPGFEQSSGVRAEIALALWMGKPIYRLSQHYNFVALDMEVHYV